MICGVIKVKFNREFHNKDASEPIYQLPQHHLRLVRARSQTVHDTMYFIRFNRPD